MDGRQTSRADQVIAEITAKLDGYRDQAAAALPLLGYEATIAGVNDCLADLAHKVPEAIAALAAVAIVRSARDQQEESS